MTLPHAQPPSDSSLTRALDSFKGSAGSPKLPGLVPLMAGGPVTPIRPLEPMTIPREPVLTFQQVQTMMREVFAQEQWDATLGRRPSHMMVRLPSPIHLPEPGELLALAAGTSTTRGGADRARCPLCLR